jgi:hypothetical protein
MAIVCIRDTHELHREVVVPAGDLLIHAGNFSSAQNSAFDLERHAAGSSAIKPQAWRTFLPPRQVSRQAYGRSWNVPAPAC